MLNKILPFLREAALYVAVFLALYATLFLAMAL